MAGAWSGVVRCRRLEVIQLFAVAVRRRTAHNPVNSELLDYMDRVGMLVWSENRNLQRQGVLGQRQQPCRSRSSATDEPAPRVQSLRGPVQGSESRYQDKLRPLAAASRARSVPRAPTAQRSTRPPSPTRCTSRTPLRWSCATATTRASSCGRCAVRVGGRRLCVRSPEPLVRPRPCADEGGCMQRDPLGSIVASAFKNTILDIDGSRPITAVRARGGLQSAPSSSETTTPTRIEL